MDLDLAFIPSPSTGVIHLGPLPLRGYAFCIIAGVFAAVWIGNKRWLARGGRPGTVADIAVWAVPFGLVGGRLYHVITDYQLYFSDGRNPVDALKIWEGGLGIWGAIAFGAVGAWIGCRRRGIPLPAWADALAPGIAIAQALGRWGNWFNQELYGRPTDLPWALEIDNGTDVGTYHPTFLYESLWCVGVALLVIWADRRFTMGHGRVFALYVAAYCSGRAWIEYMRVDEAHHILGLRLNVWTAIIVFVLAVIYLVLSARMRPGREKVVEPRAAATEAGGPDTGAATKTAKAGASDEVDVSKKTDLSKKTEASKETEASDRTGAPGEADASKQAEAAGKTGEQDKAVKPGESAKAGAPAKPESPAKPGSPGKAAAGPAGKADGKS